MSPIRFLFLKLPPPPCAVLLVMICTHRILRTCHCGYSDISCRWRKTPLKWLPIRVRGACGGIVLKEPILSVRVRVITLNLQINVEFEVYLKHLDLRDEKFAMKHPSFSIRKYIKHRYGLQCFHWVLSSYKFPGSFESSNGKLWQDQSASTEASEDQLSTDLDQVKEISRMVNGDIRDTSTKRCVWRPCRNANEPVAEITDLSLQNMPKGKQVWVSGVWMS